MNDKTIRFVLYFSGIVTMLGGLQFVAPSLLLETGGIHVESVAGLFYARHWGLLVFVIGALILYAVKAVQARRAILLVAAVEKLGFVIMLTMSWSESALQGLHAVAVFDGICVLIYATYLLVIV